MTSELVHGTVVITRPRLVEAGAQPGCFWLGRLADVLPATLSTDPEDNLDLALRLVEEHDELLTATVVAVDNHDDSDVCNLSWLLRVADIPLSDWTTGGFGPYLMCTHNVSGYRPGSNVMAIQQWLAMVADALLTREGR